MQNFRTNNLILALLAIVFTITNAIAQAPQAIPYQAAARNSSGVIITNKTIALRFTLHDAGTTGTIVYQEKQNAVTNALGMFIVNIGQGTIVTGAFSSINWSVNSKFMQVELDTSGTGTSYTDMGTQQLMSVPYALNAKKADSATSAYNGVPAGTIVAFGGDNAHIPSGWRLCDGSILNRSDYPALFAAIGSNYGSSSSTTFTLPYTNGQFLRGTNNGAASDLDAASRYAAAPGGNSGDLVGSYQNDFYAAHQHMIPLSVNGAASTSAIFGGVAYPTSSKTGNVGYGAAYGTGFQVPPTVNNISLTSQEGGTETRPKNVYVNYIIKY